MITPDRKRTSTSFAGYSVLSSWYTCSYFAEGIFSEEMKDLETQNREDEKSRTAAFGSVIWKTSEGGDKGLFCRSLGILPFM